MDPQHEATPKPVPPAKPAKARTQAEMDAYAQSLIKMVNMDYAQHQAVQPVQKRYFTKKRMIYWGVSIIFSIVLTVVYNHIVKSKTGTSSGESQTQQLLNTTQTFSNPNSY